MSKWVGYAVSVSCGEPLGCYQGTIAAADGSTITLTKAFRNGFPYPKAQVTLNAADIKELRIIEECGAPAAPATSTVAVAAAAARGKKGARATVCENLQANSSASGNQTSQSSGGKGSRGGGGGGGTPGGGAGGPPAPARSQPIDIQGARPAKSSNQPGSCGHSGSGGALGGGGGGRWGERARRRNEACFGAAADLSRDEFDFEGNLALFDKRALWEQMGASTKPDLVRQAEAGKYRHDENVLGGGGAGAGGQPLALPARLAAGGGYVTDAGALVPAAAPHARAMLWHLMDQYGVGESARALAARAVADVCLRLAGGGRRLEPANAHQRPAAVALAAPSPPPAPHHTSHTSPGAAVALLAARILASHGVAVAVHTPGPPEAIAACSAVQRELAALALCGVLPRPLEQLPPSPDLLLLALPEPGGDAHTQAALAYACAARGAAVLVEPHGGEGAGAGVAGEAGVAAGAGAGEWPCVRAAVCALAPPPPPPAAAGRVYLADAAPPPAVFAALGARYRAPFGAAPLLALHPAPPDLVPDLA